MISGFLPRMLLTILRIQPYSLLELQALLAGQPGCNGLGAVWHTLRAVGLIERCARGTAIYRLTKAGRQRQKETPSEIPPAIRERLGLPKVEETDISDNYHQTLLDDIVSVVRRNDQHAQTPREIYLQLPAKPGGKKLDYTDFGKCLIELVEEGRLVWSGRGRARRYATPENKRLLSPVLASIPSK